MYGMFRSELSGVVPPLLLPSNFLNFCSAKLVIRTRPPPDPPDEEAGLAVYDLGSVGAELGQGLPRWPTSFRSPSGLGLSASFCPPSLLLLFSGLPGSGQDLVVASQSGSMSE